MHDVVAEGLDVAVRVGDLQDSALYATRLGTAQRSVVAARELAAKLNLDQRLPTHPEQLADHDCVIYTGLTTPNLWVFDPVADATAGIRVRVQGRFATSSTELVREAVLSGLPLTLTATEASKPTVTKVETKVPPPNCTAVAPGASAAKVIEVTDRLAPAA